MGGVPWYNTIVVLYIGGGRGTSRLTLCDHMMSVKERVWVRHEPRGNKLGAMSHKTACPMMSHEWHRVRYFGGSVLQVERVDQR